MNLQTTLLPDRLIWLSLLLVMTAALIADQARANLHPVVRAAGAFTATIDDRPSAEAWCRMHIDTLTGDAVIELDNASNASSPADDVGRGSVDTVRVRRARYADALR